MNQHKISLTKGLTFDDILLVPNYTEVKREEIDVSTQLTKDLKLAIPLISAPMDTVTDSKLAVALGKLGGLGVIHRNFPIEKEVSEVQKVKKEIAVVAAAIGPGKDAPERIKALDKAGLDVAVIDSAHGFSKWVVELTRFISQKYPRLTLICGNVGTASGAKALIEAGAKALRVGIGPGSICSTRIVAGVGIPQITAILETVAIARKYGVAVIADGGLRYSGDIVKALACGATAVMSGSLFAGCFESVGKLVSIDGKKYKSYRGMGSVSAMKAGSSARYGQDYRHGQEKRLIEEGVEGYVSYKGMLQDTVMQLIGGLRSGMYYVGAKNLEELTEKTRLIEVSQASQVESHPHDIFLK